MPLNCLLKDSAAELFHAAAHHATCPARTLLRTCRGGGLLSLEALVWMAQRQHDTFRGLMEKQAGTRSSWEYPFAAATVNVAFLLVQVTRGMGAVRGGWLPNRLRCWLPQFVPAASSVQVCMSKWFPVPAGAGAARPRQREWQLPAASQRCRPWVCAAAGRE